MDLKALLQKGYFPREIPHPFNTSRYGEVVSSDPLLPDDFENDRKTSIASVHNLARSGALRRKLSIPNPLNYYRLSKFITENYEELSNYAIRSDISLTKPGNGTSPRAINPQFELRMRPIERAKLYASSRFILKADISRYYHSIYTHSISWAIHSKITAKANRSNTLIGNRLDQLVRNAQDGQTIGIPIGPDSSLLISEIILGAIDQELMQSVSSKAFRSIDDYEFGFKSYAEAENTLGLLQEGLNHYELSLNPKKTSIMKLPVRIEPLWIAELRSFYFRNSEKGQESDLLRYFDLAFEMASSDPDEDIMKYAISRMNGIQIERNNWLLFQNSLSQCCLIEPGSLRFVIAQLARYNSIYEVERTIYEECFNDLIVLHAPLGHGSEVAWAMWALILLNIPIHSEQTAAVSVMEDPVVALLALDAQSKGLVPSEHTFDHFATHMTTDDLYGDHWLLAYEANVKGWLPSASANDNVDSDSCFSHLKQNGISFYNESLSIDCAIIVPLSDTSTGGGGGGIGY